MSGRELPYIARASLPMFFLMILAVLLLYAVPGIATWLPSAHDAVGRPEPPKTPFPQRGFFSPAASAKAAPGPPPPVSGFCKPGKTTNERWPCPAPKLF